jgi:hypothetical protein
MISAMTITRIGLYYMSDLAFADSLTRIACRKGGICKRAHYPELDFGKWTDDQPHGRIITTTFRFHRNQG